MFDEITGLDVFYAGLILIMSATFTGLVGLAFAMAKEFVRQGREFKEYEREERERRRQDP